MSAENLKSDTANTSWDNLAVPGIGGWSSPSEYDEGTKPPTEATSIMTSDSENCIRNLGAVSLQDLKTRMPDEQLEYVSSLLEAGQADTAFTFFGGMDRLEDISRDTDFSPLVRLFASSGKYLDANSIDDDMGDKRAFDKNTFGYSTIVYPEAQAMSSSLGDFEQKDDAQIEAEIASIEAKLHALGAVSSGAPEEDIFWNYSTRLADLELAQKRLCFEKNQQRLHQEFPDLPADKQLVKIASDAAATVEFTQKFDPDESSFTFSSSLGLVSNGAGRVAPVSEINTLMNTDKNMSKYIEALHAKVPVEPIPGLSMSDLSLDAQGLLLKFMAESTNERFDRLSHVMANIQGTELRQKFLENFIATDFGTDFGDALLDIAQSERYSEEQVGEILDLIGNVRGSIKNIAGLYQGFDEDFASEYARAANERLTDALMAFRQIGSDGEARADLGWFGEAKFDYNSAMEALKYESKSLEVIGGTLTDVSSGYEGAFAEKLLNPDTQHQRSLYSFYSPQYGYTLLYTRPEGAGSFDPMLEYGKVRSKYNIEAVNGGVEASISLIVNPVDPFRLPNPFRPDHRRIKDPDYYDPATMDKVSALRLDREGRAPNAPTDDPNRDPINEVGTISVDLAAINDRLDTPSGKIARLFSVGGKLRQEYSGTTEENFALNHNTKWFEQEKYGTTEGFRQLAQYIDNLATRWCMEHPAANNAGFKGAANRHRGLKVVRTA